MFVEGNMSLRDKMALILKLKTLNGPDFDKLGVWPNCGCQIGSTLIQHGQTSNQNKLSTMKQNSPIGVPIIF